ncbi:hypothetical protein CLV98_101686 [Dyadobacter jejuensis]|uniref:Uncharacterized protein n=1 Tax=Dyadobacter jejuensis TaxID=1082580 RepID=A0A316ASB0_9BACT|nr:hypothetical protein CLV98_101686 [Dyadobacter jejuensis]
MLVTANLFTGTVCQRECPGKRNTIIDCSVSHYSHETDKRYPIFLPVNKKFINEL